MSMIVILKVPKNSSAFLESEHLQSVSWRSGQLVLTTHYAFEVANVVVCFPLASSSGRFVCFEGAAEVELRRVCSSRLSGLFSLRIAIRRGEVNVRCPFSPPHPGPHIPNFVAAAGRALAAFATFSFPPICL